MLLSLHTSRASKLIILFLSLWCSGLLALAEDAPLVTEQSFPFDDIYRIELELPVRGKP